MKDTLLANLAMTQIQNGTPEQKAKAAQTLRDKLKQQPYNPIAVFELARYDEQQGKKDDAIRLFADRAAASLPGFTLGRGNILTVAAICRALDGLPLAIELAAAWVRVLSVDQICARLGNRFALLVTGDRSASPRQRAMRATIEWSYALLTEAQTSHAA